MRQLQRAFTLIELLVVIAIIAILAALLFPVFAEAKNSAKITVCISNMKQISAAFHLYMGDNDDVWAPSANNTSAGPNFNPQNPWVGYDTKNAFGSTFQGNMLLPARNPIRPGMLDPYLKSHAVKQCPSRPSQWQMALAYNFFHAKIRSGNNLTDTFSAYHNVNPRARGNEYGPGNRVITYQFGYATAEPAASSEVERAAETIVVWEHMNPSPVCNFLYAPNWLNTPPNAASNRNHFNFLHRNGTTTVWADGHANRMIYQQLRRPMFSSRKDIYE